MAKETGSEDIPMDYEELYYHKKDQTKSYREIVLEAIEKCRIEGSKQMTKGGEYMLENGIVITAPDQRQIYIYCVEALYGLLFFIVKQGASSSFTYPYSFFSGQYG